MDMLLFLLHCQELLCRLSWVVLAETQRGKNQDVFTFKKYTLVGYSLIAIGNSGVLLCRIISIEILMYSIFLSCKKLTR